MQEQRKPFAVLVQFPPWRQGLDPQCFAPVQKQKSAQVHLYDDLILEMTFIEP